MPPITERIRPKEQLAVPIKRLFIANRGEIAVRAALACEKRGIEAVIPYSDLDSERESYVTRLADKHTGDNWALARLEGVSAEDTYANPQAVLNAAKLYECDSIFLGYGFLAENDEFVSMCEKEGIRVLAPPSDAMQITGNKTNAKELARKNRIPILKGFPTRTSLDDLVKDAETLGYPVMMKDPNQGGGRGNLPARNLEELKNVYTQLRFGENKGLFVEQLVENAAHVEIQFARDKKGNVVCLGERDCSVQRDYQKIIEESPSPNITDSMRQDMQKATGKIARAAKYFGVGTVEFLIDLDKPITKKDKGYKEFHFMEINPRLQVEHGVTEQQTGIDIVNLMFDIAEGKSLPFTQKDIKPQGHTIEVRIYAEDPLRNFEPQEGKLDRFRLPEDMTDVRIDKGYEEGDEITSYYDQTLCKIIAHGNTRKEALHRLEQALDQSQIAGVKTNRELLVALIDTPTFRQGKATTNFIKEYQAEKQREARRRTNGITELLGENGIFTPYPPSRIMDDINFPVNPTIKTTNSNRLKTRREIMQEQRENTGKEMASEYGIIERDGIQFVVFALNADFNNGAVGKAEGLMFGDACKLANKLNLPLITVTSTAGMRNSENNQALQMMTNTMYDLTSMYPPLFHIDIRNGWVLGGPPASYSGKADLFIMTNTPSTKKGLTGPYAVATGEGLSPTDEKGNPSTTAVDSYRVLDEAFGAGTTHTPARHHEQRTGADILVSDLSEAGDKITHILHIVKKRHPHLVVDNSYQVFRPKEHIGYLPMPHPIALYSSPDTPLPGWVPPRISQLWERVKHLRHLSKEENTVFTRPYTVSERLRILENPNRPTALDYIDTTAELFEDSALLNHVAFVNGIYQTVPIIGAFAMRNEFPLLVIAQQPQTRKKENGEIETYYEPIRPADWRYTRRLLDLAEKLDIMVLLYGDTTGAAAGRNAEDQGQTEEIAATIWRVVNHRTPIISINIRKGSGGGVPFVWFADASAGMENSLSSVADFAAMQTFLQGDPLVDPATATDEQKAKLYAFMDQLPDSTAEEMKRSYEIDAILKEGTGGAHINPWIVIDSQKEWLDEILPMLWERYQRGELITERNRRKGRVENVGTIVNPTYAEQIANLQRPF